MERESSSTKRFSKGRQDVPDILLFANEETKQKAIKEKSDDRRYRHGMVIVESKRWQRPLDRGEQSDRLDPGTPSNQILRYLSRVDVASDGAIQWGMLTNGRYWRLYYQKARSRSEEFIEFDLATLVGMEGLTSDMFSPESQSTAHYLKVFYLLFSRSSFLPTKDDAQGLTFHAIALNESRLWEERVSQDLGNLVFEKLFPGLVSALAQHDPETPDSLNIGYLESVRRDAMVLLYRLLFVMYAEDRNLLPVRDSRYDDYSARKIRINIAKRIDKDDVFSDTAKRYYTHLKDLFTAIGEGDPSIGLPPYNGGLFDDDLHPILGRALLPDAIMAPLIDSLSRRKVDMFPQWINYRDLSVQHLGSVYEKLLEYTVVTDKENKIQIQPSIYARKGSGSYYTHDDLVQLIIEETVTPLIGEIVCEFDQQQKAYKRKRNPLQEKIKNLKDFDPATRILELKICDPAMGSGHFLVSLVDFIADRTLELMESAPAMVTWADEAAYRSPLERRLQDIREHILSSAHENNWTIDAEQLDDRHLVRRMILKRVIYGVDKNPVAVELAKVALWLHTFTVGAPLSFLDHHLVVGDALHGEHIQDVLDDLREFGAMFQQNVITRIGVAAESMARLSEITDVDIAEVKDSRSLFGDIHKELDPLDSLLDFWQTLRWITPIKIKDKWQKKLHDGLPELMDGKFGDILDVISSRHIAAQHTRDMAAGEALYKLLGKTRQLAE